MESGEPMSNDNLWEYEAPQYCDFEAQETFEPDSESDKFFLTDHEVGKENFLTPSRESFASSEDNETFHSAKKTWNFRETPLRSKSINGATPYRESRPSSIWGGRKSRRGTPFKKSLVATENTICNESISTNRDTFDLSALSEATREISQLDLDDSKNATLKDENKVDDVDKINDLPKDLLSEEEEEALPAKEDHQLSEQQTLEGLVAEEEKEMHFMPAESADLMTNEALPESEEINKSHRSSYVVKSPVVPRTVHFESVSEDQVTPQMPASALSKSAIKIKTRQPTPMLKPGQDATTKHKLRIARFQKYIKRFSKTPCKDDDESKIEVSEKVKESKVAEDEKQGKVKNGNELKRSTSMGPTKMTHKQQMASCSRLSSKPLTTKGTQPRRFVSLAELSNNFLLNSARQYPVPSQTPSGKLSSTKPKAPKLLTSQRALNSHVHLKAEKKSELVLKQKPQVKIFKQPIVKQINNLVKKEPTKAVTPVLCTDIRSRFWMSKHQRKETEKQGTSQNQVTFKARPVPNFKLLQSRVARRLKVATGSKHRVIQTNPFSFESRVKLSEKNNDTENK